MNGGQLDGGQQLFLAVVFQELILMTFTDILKRCVTTLASNSFCEVRCSHLGIFKKTNK